MATRGPTNKQLEQTLKDGFEGVGKRLDKVEGKVQTFHDYMVGQKAVAASNPSVNVTSELLNIMKWLILIVGGLVGIRLS